MLPFHPLIAHNFSVKLGAFGNHLRSFSAKQPVIIPPQLRGLVSFSRSLYTLHLYDKGKKIKIKRYDNFLIFFSQTQQLSTPAEEFFIYFFFPI